MGKFDGVLLVSDYDDTLFDQNLTVYPRNLAAIRSFIAQGGAFTVATGRVHPTFARQAAALPLNAPVILGNGGSLYDFSGEEYLAQSQLDPRAGEDLKELAAAFPDIALELYHGDELYLYRPNRFTAEHLERVKMEGVSCAMEEVPTPWSKAIVEGEYGRLCQVQGWLQERLSTRYEIIFSNRLLLEITPKGATKGAMVETLSRHLHIKRENIYCVGDNQNDISMLALSAVPFAPANCVQEIRDMGAVVLCHCNDGVIGDVVEILEKRYP